MAESESGQDRSEEPTEKRLRESREKGQIARSRELSTLAVVLAGCITLLATGGSLAVGLSNLMRANFELSRETVMDERSMALYLLASGELAMILLIPLFVVLLAASIIGPIALGGWLFSAQAMQPKFSRMDPHWQASNVCFPCMRWPNCSRRWPSSWCCSVWPCWF